MRKIKYPKLKRTSLTIGVTAPSSGLSKPSHIERFELVVKQHISKGIKIIKGKCLGNKFHPVSDSKENRVKDFLRLWNNPSISIIQPPWGGEHVIDILELLPFKSLRKKPTWVQGYSDISTLLFAITTLTGIATVHGANFIDSIEGQDLLTTNSRDYVYLKMGEKIIQRSSKKWQKIWTNFSEKVDATYNLTEITKWKTLNSLKKEFSVSGRIIGGCIDTLIHLVGTPYGNLKQFHLRYAEKEGLILYLENCEQKPMELFRSLMTFKYAGWFDNVNAIVFGRNTGPDSEEYSYVKCLKNVFKEMEIPIVWDADIGHNPPQMTIINGSFAELHFEKGKALLVQHLK